MKTRIILVGGFLGAGKTTLLCESARMLSEQGKHVGLITNDQASGLVDTAFLERSLRCVTEVSGSCFCCNFNGFVEAISHLKAKGAMEMIIAEPVGSCTDLSATIIQPLKQKFEEDLIVSPLSVLVDPERLNDILKGGTSGLHESSAYILQKQLDEADMIVITKIDLLTSDELETLKRRVAKRWPLAKIFSLSAKSGEGLDLWLDEVTHSTVAGTHLAEVDYDIYAQGEAVLGWLNTTVTLKGHSVNWDAFTHKMLKSLAERFDTLNLTVGHIKVLLEADKKYNIGNVTGKSESLSIRGSAGSGNQAQMTLNARVEMNPAALDRIVTEVISEVCGNEIVQKIEASKCLQPGRPNPTYRYDYVVR